MQKMQIFLRSPRPWAPPGDFLVQGRVVYSSTTVYYHNSPDLALESTSSRGAPKKTVAVKLRSRPSGGRAGARRREPS